MKVALSICTVRRPWSFRSPVMKPLCCLYHAIFSSLVFCWNQVWRRRCVLHRRDSALYALRHFQQLAEVFALFLHAAASSSSARVSAQRLQWKLPAGGASSEPSSWCELCCCDDLLGVPPSFARLAFDPPERRTNNGMWATRRCTSRKAKRGGLGPNNRKRLWTPHWPRCVCVIHAQGPC